MFFRKNPDAGGYAIVCGIEQIAAYIRNLRFDESDIEYLRSRAPRKVQFAVSFPEAEQFIAPLNSYLFQWVIENLCKNAVDAMEGEGRITLYLEDSADKAIIEVADTGKGIRKKDIGNVFRPGFTTKKRGWGLGLSLARRIVEDYHHGRIWVKESEVGKGTVFRIELHK